MRDIVDAALLIEVVEDDNLVFLVLVDVELRDELVGLDAGTWEVQRLTDVVLFILLRLTEVHQQKISLNAYRKLLSADGD